MPMLGRRPKPSSSRTLTPATLRRASLVVNTCELRNSSLLMVLAVLPSSGRFASAPMTSTRGAEKAVTSGSAAWAGELKSAATTAM